MKGRAFCRAALCAVFFLPLGCASVSETEDTRAASGREVSAAEEDFLLRYGEKLRYRVYIKDGAGEESALKDIVLRDARKYLPPQAAGEMTEDIKGEDAVVDIGIGIRSEGESRGENHYGTVYVGCALVEPFFGRVLDMPERPAPRTFSKASQFDAKANAAQALLSVLMPEATIQARAFLLNLYRQGLLYELVARGPNGGTSGDFQEALAARVRNLRIAQASASELSCAFAFFGFPDDVEKAVREAAGEAGMGGLKNPRWEGRRFVFDF
jgi:hypothetical protein